ncbi:hypothetical protein [Arthrobacter ginkgonis]|uniref:hypothetical protein n=1 Tax=Arthrobacter ginkgonis TaxID=1630594 RepID=UPI0031E599B8
MPDLQHVADENGVQRWESPDLSVVEYRAPDGQRMRFEAYTGSDFLVGRKIGARITTLGSQFEYAAIDNFYFLPTTALEPGAGQDQAVGQQVHSFYRESATGYSGSKLAKQEWAVLGSKIPGTVRSWCRAQWHGANFSHEVRTGPFPLALAGGPPNFPTGFPDSWDAPGGIRVNPDSLVLNAKFLGDTAVGSVQVRNREGSRQTIAVNAADDGHFIISPRMYTIRAGETKRVSVKYEGATRAGNTGTFTIAAGQQRFVVSLRGAIRPGAERP